MVKINRNQIIDEIVKAQIKVQGNIILDEDKFDLLYRQCDLLNMSFGELISACEEYQKETYKHNNKQALKIQTLRDKDLINYCVNNNLKIYNINTKLLIHNIHIAQQHRQQHFDIVYQTIKSILIPNKKFISYNIKNLLNKQVFMETYDTFTINTIYTEIKISYEQYLQNLQTKYNNMNDADLEKYYKNFITLAKLM